MKKSILLALVLAFVACKKKDAATGDGSGSGSADGSATMVGSATGSGSSATMTAAAGGAASAADCKLAIDHSMELAAPSMTKMMPNYNDVKDKMRDMGISHCTDDKWSTEAVKCMTDSTSYEASQTCYGKLTADQSEKMNKAAMALMTPAAGSGSGSGSATAGSGSGSAAAAGSAAGSGSGSAKK